MPADILIVEDDPTVNELLNEKLDQAEFCVDSAYDGKQGLTLAMQREYDLILLDIMLPEIDGFEVLQRLRQAKQTPVLLLTAKGGEQDRIEGFKTGADDYLIKPFNMTELRLRIEAILRRTKPSLFSPQENNTQQVFVFNKQQASVQVYSGALQGETLVLTLLEYALLKALADQAGEVLSKAYLYQNVLLREFSRYDRTLDMHISKIRKKLVAIGLTVNTIKTVRGQGYCLDLTEL